MLVSQYTVDAGNCDLMYVLTRYSGCAKSPCSALLAIQAHRVNPGQNRTLDLFINLRFDNFEEACEALDGSRAACGVSASFAFGAIAAAHPRAAASSDQSLC
jgi:hypothetical protein